MIRSMTAAGAAQQSDGRRTVAVEVRSVNGRSLDIGVRLPQEYAPLEERIKAAIPQWISRGRIDVRVQIRGGTPAARGAAIDEAAAVEGLERLQRLQRRLGLDGEIPLALVLGLPGVLVAQEAAGDQEDLWPLIAAGLASAMAALNTMRDREGEAMAADFTRRLETLDASLAWIESQAGELLPRYRDRLRERIAVLSGGEQPLDPARLAQEAALLADRSDISEELLRSRSHNRQFRHIMAAAEPGGRQLNFLLQEMHRELNTMGAKAGSSAMAHRIVELKSELEKIREQVQNVE
jgi:uncharacterized protein (TIGR00255 family)